MILIAHNIRSMHNVGSIFRSAAAFGIEKLYLTGISAIPPRKEIAKVALGSEMLVPWEQANIEALIGMLKQEGYAVLGLDQDPLAHELGKVKNTRVALVLGNEVEGIEAPVRDLLDGLVEIPMHAKRSLNVSVACGIACYALHNR